MVWDNYSAYIRTSGVRATRNRRRVPSRIWRHSDRAKALARPSVFRQSVQVKHSPVHPVGYWLLRLGVRNGKMPALAD